MELTLKSLYIKLIRSFHRHCGTDTLSLGALEEEECFGTTPLFSSSCGESLFIMFIVYMKALEI